MEESYLVLEEIRIPVNVSLIQCVNTGIIGGSGTLGGILVQDKPNVPLNLTVAEIMVLLKMELR